MATKDLLETEPAADPAVRLFGTDGVRGRANVDLTAELALDLSVAAAHVLTESRAQANGSGRPTALVGRDPRASGEFLEAAVVAGLASAGVDVIRTGVVPTPGCAWLVGHRRADLGVMLSASHNPMPDNGIKFFARGGAKLDDAVEDLIERQMGAEWRRPVGGEVGRVLDDPKAVDAYVDHLVSTLSDPRRPRPARLDGLTVVVDCANGAAYRTGPEALRRLGAQVMEIHAAPDGININDHCGSTHPEELQRAVLQHGADLGLAFDGDADRCLAVDAQGEIVDGDQILAILALDLADAGALAGDTVVATVMSNLGFVQAMRAHGLEVRQTKVGDRYLLEAMRSGGFVLGGEQSGHVVMADFATTGDGVLTGLHVMARMARTGKPLTELAQVMTRLPQVLINVPDVDKSRTQSDTAVSAAVRSASEELGSSGRVLLRPSGTEALVRVMVEAESQDRAQSVAERLAGVVRERLAL